MTTIIMISRDSSVIINSGPGENDGGGGGRRRNKPREGEKPAAALEAAPSLAKKEGKMTGKNRDHRQDLDGDGKIRPESIPSSSLSAQESSSTTISNSSRNSSLRSSSNDDDEDECCCVDSSTPDASFLTPRPIVPAESSSSSKLSRKKGPHGRRSYKNSVSTQESDSEEASHHCSSSSGAGSAASTLSSGIVITPSSSSSSEGRKQLMLDDGAFDLGRLSTSTSSSNCSSSTEKKKANNEKVLPRRGTKTSLPPRTQSFNCRTSSSEAGATVSSNLLAPSRRHLTPPAKPERSSARGSPANGPHGLKFFLNPSSGRMDLRAPAPPPSASPSLTRAAAQQQQQNRHLVQSSAGAGGTNSLDRRRSSNRMGMMIPPPPLQQQRPRSQQKQRLLPKGGTRQTENISVEWHRRESLYASVMVKKPETKDHRPSSSSINVVGLPSFSSVSGYCTLSRRQQQQQQLRRHYNPFSSLEMENFGKGTSAEESHSVLGARSLISEPHPAERIRTKKEKINFPKKEEDGEIAGRRRRRRIDAPIREEDDPSSNRPPAFSIYSDIDDFRSLVMAGSTNGKTNPSSAATTNTKLTKKPSLRDSTALAPFWDEDESSEEDETVLDAADDHNLLRSGADDGSSSSEEDEEEERTSSSNSELVLTPVPSVATASEVSSSSSSAAVVLPTGCHRHPKHLSLPPLGAALYDGGEYGGEDNSSYLGSLLPWPVASTPVATSNNAPPKRGAEVRFNSLWEVGEGDTNASTNPYSSLTRIKKRRRWKGRAPERPAESNGSGISGAKSLDCGNASIISQEDSYPTSSAKRSSLARLRLLSGLNLAGSTGARALGKGSGGIVRRHTTYVKSGGAAEEEGEETVVHVHSWHRKKSLAFKEGSANKKVRGQENRGSETVVGI